MRYQHVCIEGMGYYIPDHVVTSDWIEDQLDPLYQALSIPKGRIERLTKIRERRWFDEGVAFSDAATRAAEKALEDAGVDRGEVQFLVNTSVCRDYIEPSTATIVHANLDLPATAANFDLSNACLGFLNDRHSARRLCRGRARGAAADHRAPAERAARHDVLPREPGELYPGLRLDGRGLDPCKEIQDR